MPDEIDEKAAELAQVAAENANDVIAGAVDNANEIKGDALDTVNQAAQALQEITEETKKQQEEISWQAKTEKELEAVKSQMAELTSTHQAIPSQLEAMKAELLAALTLPNQPPPENAGDLPEQVSEAALLPDQQSEKQSPPPKPARNWL